MTLSNINNFLIITQAEFCTCTSFMFVTIFLDMKILVEKSLLTCPVQSIIKQLNETKNNNFYFHFSLWRLRKVSSF